MGNYISLRTAIRQIHEKQAKKHMAPDGGPETDLNDQIAVGSYQTKSFEMSNRAQKLYSNLPPDTESNAAEQAAIHLDKLFDIDKDTSVRGHASQEDLAAAKQHAEKITKLAQDMGLEAEHERIVNDSLDAITARVEKAPERIIDPGVFDHPSKDPRFNTPSKDYVTDRTSDRDVDNVKNFLIRRSLKAQRKLKIIDD